MNHNLIMYLPIVLLVSVLGGCNRTSTDKMGPQETYDQSIVGRVWETTFEGPVLDSINTDATGGSPLRSTDLESLCSSEEATLARLIDFLNYRLADAKRVDGATFRALADVSMVVDRSSHTIRVSKITLQRFDRMPDDILFTYGFIEGAVVSDHPELEGFLQPDYRDVDRLSASSSGRKYAVGCEGGEKDGESIVVDRDIKGAKKALKFLDEYIDGGGCVKVCEAKMTLLL